MPFLDDAFKEIREVEAFTSRSATANERARNIGPVNARRINELAEAYPFLSPDSLMALGRTGLGVDNPVVRQVAEIEARKTFREHPGGRRYGSPSITPGQRRLMNFERERAGTVPTWKPQSGNPDAIAAWDEARRSGLVVEGVLTRPTGPDHERLGDKFEDVLDRLTLAGEEVPVMSLFGGEEEGYWKAQIARRAAEPSVQEQMHAGRGEALRMSGQNRIQWQDIEGPEVAGDEAPSRGMGRFGGGAGRALTSRLPGATERTRYEVNEQRGTQSSGVTSLRQVAQGSFAAMDVGVQEFQGLVRNLYGATHGKDVDWWETQSDLGIALTTSIDDMGGGFFVDQESEVAVERRRREEERGQIGGHNITLGRWLADATPFATDSKPSLLFSGFVDLGVQIADPTAWALGKVGKAGTARKLFQAADLVTEGDAGIIRGLRTVLNGRSAKQFLDSSEGAARLRFIADENSPTRMWQGFNRKISFDTARQLADEVHTPEEARAVLEPMLGTSIRHESTVAMPRDLTGGGFNSPIAGRPSQMPLRGPIDAHDKDVVGHEVEAWLSNINATGDEIALHVDRVARSDTPQQLNAAIRETLRGADGILIREGVKDDKLRDMLVSLADDTTQAGSDTFKAVSTAQTPTYDTLVANGVPVHDMGANLYIEHAPKFLTLPDARNLRRAVSKYSRILQNPDTGGLRMGFAAVDFLQNEIWKPVQLVTRIAWPVRVIMEEQVRMAAAGYDSMFKNPASFVAWGVGRRGRGKADSFLHPVALAGDVVGRKGQTGVTGEIIEDMQKFKDGMVHGNGEWVDRKIASGKNTTYNKTDVRRRREFVHAWAEGQLDVHYDPVAHHLANSSSLDDSKQWFTRGAGNKYRGDMAAMHPTKFESTEQADAYMEIVGQRIERMHGGNTELADVIRTGKWRGKDVFDGNRIDPEYLDWLDEQADQFGPESVIGEAPTQTYNASRARGAVDRMFSLLMTERTNRLSRSRVFKQAYWREAERLIPFATEDTKQQIIAAAKAANLEGHKVFGNRAVARMERAVARGDLELDDVDLIAKGHGLDQTRELLYDLSRRGRKLDAMRLVFPFGEAWSEVLTRWFGTGLLGGEATGLVWKNPKTIRRFQQLMQGARGEQFGELMGAPEDAQGNSLGFFWENSFGEEVFIYPGTSILSEHVLGVPVPLTGRVQGLSMFGTIMPGLGPVTQIPVGWFLAAKPGPQAFKEFLNDVESIEVPVLDTTLKEQVLPFGAVGSEDQGEILELGTYAPPWIRNLYEAVSEGDLREDAYASTVAETMAYLRSTGKYEDSIAGMQALTEDAQDKARGLYFMRAIVGMAAPASPDFEFMVEGDHGNLIRLAALRDELFGMMDEDPRTAGNRFLDKYGPDVHAAVATSATTSSRLGTPMTQAGVQWVLEHPGIEDDLTYTYGLFAPEGGPDDFSLYRDEMRQGDRVRLKPEAVARLMNNTKGDMLWRQAKSQIEGSPNREEQQWLREVADLIREEYPGWGDDTGRLEGSSTDTLVAELERAVNHPAVKNTDAAAGLRLYLKARDKAIQQSVDEGLSPNGFREAERMEGTRVWLNDVATSIMEEHPDFEPLWTWVFSREAEVEAE